ncbi:hypothetical protein GCM10029992_61570 [Glycomyces albus]
MTDTPQGNSEIADYRLAVERHLLDLPAPIREDLLSGLEEHLAEVAAERDADMTLEELLGSPEAYARELRETVEVRRESLGDRLRRKVAEPLASRSKGAAERFTASAGVGDAAEFRKALKPGWWVLRGVLAAVLISFVAITIDGGMQHFYGEFAPFTVAAVVALTLLCVWLSLRLGVRSERWGRNYQRMVAVAGGGLLAIVAWGLYWGPGPRSSARCTRRAKRSTTSRRSTTPAFGTCTSTPRTAGC